MKDYILFIVAMLIFGSNGVFASMLDMSGAQLVLMRTLIGGAVLLIIILIARSRTPREAVSYTHLDVYKRQVYGAPKLSRVERWSMRRARAAIRPYSPISTAASTKIRRHSLSAAPKSLLGMT